MTEIGDIYVVNKSDLAGTNQLFDAVRDYIGDSKRNPTILKTSVKKNSGISVFAKTLHDMMKIKMKFKTEKDLERFEAELKDIVLNNIKEKVEEMIESNDTFSNYIKKLESKKMDPFTAGAKISKSLIK